MKSTPADHRAAEIHESLVDVITLIEARAQATELVEQRDGLLDHVAEDSQAAAVGLAPSCDGGADAVAREDHPVRIAVVAAVPHDLLGLAQRRADFTADRRDRINQRDQLCHVVAIGCGERAGQRHAVGIDRQMVLGVLSRFMGLL